MKLTKITRDRLRPLLEKLIDNLGTAFVVSCYESNRVTAAFDLWYKLYANINHNDDNPNVIFVGEKRLFSQDVNFRLYPDNTDDNTLKTGLLKILDGILG